MLGRSLRVQRRAHFGQGGPRVSGSVTCCAAHFVQQKGEGTNRQVFEEVEE